MNRKPFPMTLYIAGPMTGLPDFNKPAFLHAEKQLVAAGFHVLNPVNNVASDWTGYMRMSLHQVANADGLYMLRGWRDSKGASLEHKIAQELGLVIRYESDLVAPEKELKMMATEGASTADLGRELLRQTEDAKPKVHFHSIHEDLKTILTWMSEHPVKIDSRTGEAARRLKGLTHP